MESETIIKRIRESILQFPGALFLNQNVSWFRNFVSTF